MRNEKAVLNELLSWSWSQENIRIVVMTGSRASPNAHIDIFSDYDIELIVIDLREFIDREQWIFEFGNVIANIKERNSGSLTNLVLYDDGVRIDFQIYPLLTFLKETGRSIVPDHWNIGYKILLDKDGITEMLRTPTHTQYNINMPNEEEFASVVKDFWWDTTYVAKSLWRGEIYYAKYVFDDLIHYGYLKKMIEWHIGIANNWSVNTNKYGRWFKRYLERDTWNQVENTFSDSNIENNWEALFATTDLFKRIAFEIAKKLDYSYNIDMEKNITTYIKKIRRLEKDAKDF